VSGEPAAVVTAPGVAVLLSTWNGAAWLPAQLESLLAQTHAGWTLVVRDDGSTDGTRALLDAYAERDARIRILPADGRRLGACGSFGALLEAVDAPWIAFCDQDDVWHPAKLERALGALRALEAAHGAATPLLVHSDLRPVRADGTPIAESFLAYQSLRPVDGAPLRELLAQNFVTGCAVTINRALRAAAAPVPAGVIMHDWWLALVAAATGRVQHLPEATIDYRQHGGNTIGAKRLLSRRSLERVLRAGELDAAVAATVRQARALRTRLAERGIDGERRRLVEALVPALERGGPPAAAAALRHGLAKQGAVRTALFYGVLLRGRYARGLA